MHILIIAFLAVFGVIAAPTCSSRKSFPSFSFSQLAYLTMIAYAVTDPLPVINFPLPESWAGEIPIGASYGNDTLFFWLWEAQAGAWSDDLISESHKIDWIIHWPLY